MYILLAAIGSISVALRPISIGLAQSLTKPTPQYLLQESDSVFRKQGTPRGAYAQADLSRF
jgi:hypothetical protein